MIIYDSNRLCFIWRCEGSRIPKAALYATPSVVLAVLSHFLIDGHEEDFRFLENINQSVVWAAMVIVLGILLGVRTNKAYDRFWEGITLVQQMRAEWFEATSNLLAFSMVAVKRDSNMEDKVREFQQVLVRLMSLMHGAALRQIGGEDEEFDVLDLQAIDVQSLTYLADCELAGMNRVETLLHWIQVLVTENVESGVIVVPAPIVTRAYQTLSRGMVNLHNARKLADVPFPFPLSQMIVALLLVQSVITPFFVASAVSHPIYAAVVTFLPMFGMWSVTFIAGELEQPFGSDPNDLPLSVLQFDFNMTLLMLLDEEASRVPTCVKKKAQSVQNLRSSLLEGEKNDKSPSSSRGTTSRVTNPNTFRPEDYASASTRFTWYASENIALERGESELSQGRQSSPARQHGSSPGRQSGLSMGPSARGSSHQQILERRRRQSVRVSSGNLSSNHSAIVSATLVNLAAPDDLEEKNRRIDPGEGLGSFCLASSGSEGFLTYLEQTSEHTLQLSSSQSNPRKDLADLAPSPDCDSPYGAIRYGQTLALTSCVEQRASASEEHLNALLNASRQTTEVVKLLLKQARKLKTSSLPPMAPVFEQKRRPPGKVKTPPMESPMGSPRESDFESLRSSVPLKVDC